MVVVSDGPWRRLNPGMHSGDDLGRVLENRALLMHDWAIDQIQWLRQVHGADVGTGRLRRVRRPGPMPAGQT